MSATMKAFVNKRQGDELVYGVAEVPTPPASDEKDLVIKVEAAPINDSDTCSATSLPQAMLLPPSQYFLPQLTPTRNLSVARVWCDRGCWLRSVSQSLLGKRVAVAVGSSYAEYTKTSRNNPRFAVLPDDM